MKKPTFELPKCERCGTKAVYTRVDGTVVCKRCGFVKKKEAKQNE
jgi:ribosomal protein L37E